MDSAEQAGPRPAACFCGRRCKVPPKADVGDHLGAAPLAGTSVAVSFIQTPVYEASATVLVGQQQGQGDSPARVEELQALIPSAVEIITTAR